MGEDMSEEIEQSEVAEDLTSEDKARIVGWKPKEEYKGDPEHWTDADDFIAKRDDNLKMLRDATSKLEREVAKLKKQNGRSEREGFNRAMEAIAQRQLTAVETGDVDAFKEAESDRKQLEAKKDEPEVDQVALNRAFVEWRVENDWYGTHPVISAWADQAAEDLMGERGGGLLDADGLAELAEKVKAKFSKKYPAQFGIVEEEEAEEKPRKRSPVEAVPQARGRGGVKTAADLDPRAQQLADQMVRMGLYKDRNEYAKDLYRG